MAKYNTHQSSLNWQKYSLPRVRFVSGFRGLRFQAWRVPGLASVMMTDLS